jgi:hypothetical protein
MGIEPGEDGEIVSNDHEVSTSGESAPSDYLGVKSAKPGELGPSETIAKETATEPASPFAGVVETALAEALTRAAAAAQWSVVEAIAAELRARREARGQGHGAEVASISDARSKRQGGQR